MLGTTADQYAEAYAQTFATFLARAVTQHQRFKTFDLFAKAAKAGTISLEVLEVRPRPMAAITSG
jgi:hypothetical protein